MKILILGKNGQLGTELVELMREKKINALNFGKNDLNITSRLDVMNKITEVKPDIVINCTAYTDVDKAEYQDNNLNYQVNHIGVKNIAEACDSIGAILVSISTDYVFDGKYREKPYTEEDFTDPLNEYGKSKLYGENEIKKIMKNYYIIRTSWIFGKNGKNFVSTILKLANENNDLNVVNDQIGRPTWSRSLAEFILFLIEEKCEYGTYNFSNEGICTWYEFALKILEANEGININPVSSNYYQQIAKRPKYSILSLEKVKNTGFKNINWKQGLSFLLKEEME